jgi:SNF2 family DNA or RNA helicase
MRYFKVSDDGKYILLGTEYEERQLAGRLPGSRWDPRAKCWKAPATPACALAVLQMFDGLLPFLGEDDRFDRLVEQAHRRRAVRGRQPAQEPDYEYLLEPWKHQVEATRFARDMDVAMLHCWMGAGKTRVALDAARARGHRRVLVICPKSVIPVWRDETCKHAPDEWDIVLLEDGSVEDRAGRLEQATVDPPRPVLAVVNYEATWREPLAEAILSCEWDLLVFDESQRIKSPGAKQSRFAARIRAGHKLALTGTPMPHSPLDLYGQYRALDPGIFGTSFTRFRSRYAVMGGYENKQVLSFKNEDELRDRMDRICHHVPKDALDLPPLTVNERYCSLGREAARVYGELEEEFIAQLRDGVVTANNALSKLLRLQQVAAGFVKTEDGREQEMGTAKADLLREVLEDIGNEDPVVVFARFHHDLDTVKRVAEELDRGGLYKTCGEISGRVNEYQQWKRGEFSTLAVQLQAGGLGIDLTEASYLLFYTMGFSLGDYQQAIARVHRPGQERSVVVYRLLARRTVDTKIISALDRRRDVIRSILRDVQAAQPALWR